MKRLGRVYPSREGRGLATAPLQESAWFLGHMAGEGGKLHRMPQGQEEAPNKPKWFLWPLGQIEVGKKEQYKPESCEGRGRK